MQTKLADVASSAGDQKSKIDQYKALQSSAFADEDLPQLKAVVDHIALDSVPLVVSRQVLQELAVGLPSLATAGLQELGKYTLDKVQRRGVSFEEQASTIREHLAQAYEKEEEWAAAAQVLAAIPLDSGIRVLDDNYKVEKYIKISMLYLQDEEAVSAETCVGRLRAAPPAPPARQPVHRQRSAGTSTAPRCSSPKIP